MTEDEPEMELLIDHLNDSSFSEYHDWCNAVWAMYACGMTSEGIHYRSCERCPDKYDWDSTEA